MEAQKDIEALMGAYRNENLSPVDVVQTCLSKIEASDLNAFLSVNTDGALKRAEALEKDSEARKSLPLYGVPIGVKDVLAIEGQRTTCASKILENYHPPYTATAIERLESQGAIVLGKLNMDEFAMGSSNENSAFGAVKHPTHPDRVPGGSSGGSAAAVKAGLCYATLGSDTGGSIRLPASFCGVVGMKPTYGRVSRYGLVAYASSLDQVGPFGNSVLDCASILEAMAGHDPRDSTSAPVEKENWSQALGKKAELKGLKVGVPKEYFVGGLQDEVQSGVQNVLNWLKSEGAELVELSLPHTQYAVPVYYIVAVSEASSNLSRYDGVKFGNRTPDADTASSIIEFYERVRSQFGAEVKRRIILGTFALSSGYYDAYYRKACQVRRLIKNDFDEAFEKVDVIASPVSPTTAFKQGEKVSDPLQMYLEDAFTIPVNLAGLPGLSLPCGKDAEDLPIGFQLIGAPFQESKLFGVASRVEEKFGGDQ